ITHGASPVLWRLSRACWRWRGAVWLWMSSRQLHPRRSPTRCSSSLSRLRERVRERALLLLRAFVPLLISAFCVRIGSALLGGFLLAVAPKGTKRACPAIRPSASLRVRSLHHCSEGRLTRAIPGPLSLSPHPCG